MARKMTGMIETCWRYRIPVWALLALLLAAGVEAQMGSNTAGFFSAATGVAPGIQATGRDTNIPMNLKTKGTGCLQVNGTCFVSSAGSIVGPLNQSGGVVFLTDNAGTLAADAQRLEWDFASTTLKITSLGNNANLVVKSDSLAFISATNVAGSPAAAEVQLNSDSNVAQFTAYTNGGNFFAMWEANAAGTGWAAWTNNGSGGAAIERLRIDSAGSLTNMGALLTPASGAGITIDSQGTLTRQVYKATFDNTAFSAAAKTADAVVGTLVAKQQLIRIYADTTTTFSGGGETVATMTCGKTAGGTEYLVSFDVFTAPITVGLLNADMGATLQVAAGVPVQGGDLPSFTATTDVQCRLTTTTNDTSGLAQGSMTVYLVTEALP